MGHQAVHDLPLPDQRRRRLREPARARARAVKLDVRDGYVTIEGALRDYGVVVEGDPENDPEGLTVDEEATKKARAER